jgi:multidrug transporter EmrE-like cation transporter
MSVSTGVLLLSALVFSVAGQLLLRSAAHDLAALDGVDFLFAAVRDVRVVSGLTAWVIWTICWLQVLRVVPLSKAYAVTSLTYVLITLASVSVLGEHVRRLQVGGIILIATGVACVLASD